MIGLLLVSAGLLVVAGALITAAGTATLSVGPSRLRTLLDEGFEGAEPLEDLLDRREPLRRTLDLLGGALNLAGLGLVIIAGTLYAGPAGATAALLAGVPLILLAGDVIPRALASRHPIRLALTSAPLLLGPERWIRPLLAPLRGLEAVLGGRNGGVELTEEEREFLEMSHLGQEEGIVDPDEHLLVQRAFRLDELRAFDVMTPRVDVFAWQDSLRLEDIIHDLRTVPYSRVPVYGDSIDDITGILYVREAYESYVGGKGSRPLSDVSREPFFVPGSLSLSQLLRDFQARRIHMGVVADEYGGTDGIVTLEDVLEELVGEIVDETDVDDEPLMRIGRDELVADGSVDLREINYAFNVSLPQLEHRSLNGYILEEMGYVPEEGESFERSGVRIDILEATDTQVVRARLKRLADRMEPVEDEVR